MTADRIIQPLADAAMWAWLALDRRADRVRDWLSPDRVVCRFPNVTGEDE